MSEERSLEYGDYRDYYGKWWDAAVLRRMQFEQRWFIENLLPTQGRLLVVAPGKTGKSIFCLQMVHCAAMGLPFLGFNVPRPLRVHYLDYEVGPIMMQDRLALMGREYDVPRNQLFVTSFPDPNDLVGTLDSVPDIDIFVVDPAISLGYTDENNNAQIRRLLDNLHRECRERGAGVILVHHTRKSSRDPNVRDRGMGEARGAGAFTDWMDYGISLRTVTEGSSYELTFLSRGGANPEPMTVQRDPESLTYSLQGTTIAMEQAAEDATREYKEANPMASSRILQADLARQLMGRTGKGRTTVYRWMALNGWPRND